MKIIKATVCFAIRDDQDPDNFIDDLQNSISEKFDPEFHYNMSAFFDKEVRSVDYPDPQIKDSDLTDRIDDWTDKSVEEIDTRIMAEQDSLKEAKVLLRDTIARVALDGEDEIANIMDDLLDGKILQGLKNLKGLTEELEERLSDE
jgi:hypothetical protein